MADDPNVRVDGPIEYQGVERRQNKRRRNLRYPFTASVDAVEPNSNAKITGRTSDISLGGCYVDTINPFPVETIIKIRLTKERVTFEADAKVVLSKVGTLPLASRALFQMDQAASADQSLLLNFRERGQVTDLDRRCSLRPGRHHQEATQSLGQSV